MTEKMGNSIQSIIQGRKPQESSSSNRKGKNSSNEEFQNLLNNTQKSESQAELSFSAHATKRIEQRELTMDNGEFIKIKNALSKLKQKGGENSLVVTGDNAYIIDVSKNKVVTAMGKDDLEENVFTKIDSTIFMN